MTRYDAIGAGYRAMRRPDPRIQAAIDETLGDARTVVNVGAGAGSYEPGDRGVAAVEPSSVMIDQRPVGSAPVVQASAEALPFEDDAFDAALAVLTIHHWRDLGRGLAEVRRVARDRVVVLTWDPAHPGFWLTDDYFPDALTFDRTIFPSMETLSDTLGGRVEVRALPIPHDCTDGFFGAYWRRPAAYLRPAVRAAISTFSRLTDVEARLERLRRDLDDGAWDRRHGGLRTLETLDVGYRLVAAT